jgi:hypothetical protein
MNAPRPSAIRLISKARGGKAPRPPFGLRAWSPDADAAAVVLDAAGLEVDEASGVASQLPLASALPAGAAVIVFGAAAGPRHFWNRLLWGGTIPVSRAARCGALIMRGYVEVGAGRDETTNADLAWGRVPGP